MFLCFYPGQREDLALKTARSQASRATGGGVGVRRGYAFCQQPCRLDSMDLTEGLSLAEICFLSLFCCFQAPLLGNGGLENKGRAHGFTPLPSLSPYPVEEGNGTNLQTSLVFSLLKVHMSTPPHPPPRWSICLFPFLDVGIMHSLTRLLHSLIIYSHP